MNNKLVNTGSNGAAVLPIKGSVADFGPNASVSQNDVEAHRSSDLITRRRDVRGNRQPWFYSHSVPIIEDVPLQETSLAAALTVIKEQFPITAAELEHEYDHKLRPTLRRLIAIRDLEEKRLTGHNDRAHQLSKELDREIGESNRSDAKAFADAETQLAEAHRDAAAKVARTGGTYNPDSPTDDSVLRIAPPNDGALAAELQLPWTPADKPAVMWWGVGWYVTIVVGMMIGLSLGILAGFIPVGDWTGHPIQLGSFLGVGVAAAIAGKWAIKHSARIPSQRYWLGKPFMNWILFAVISVLVTAAIIVIDSLVEREGLMARVRMQNLALSLSGPSKPGDLGFREWLFFLMAIILTFGYAINAYWEGYLSGRYDACLNRIRRVQAERFGEKDACWRQSEPVQAALDSLANVRNMLQKRNTLESRISERNSRVEARRLEHMHALSDEAMQRIQDAVDQLNGTQAIFDAKFAAAKAMCEGGGGVGVFGNRLRRSWGGTSQSRLRHRDSKRRIK